MKYILNMKQTARHFSTSQPKECLVAIRHFLDHIVEKHLTIAKHFLVNF
jgi:hypothetical protein